MSLKHMPDDTWTMVEVNIDKEKHRPIEFAVSKGETTTFMVKGRKGINIDIYGGRYFLQPGEKIVAKER
ncbi:MAG: hypothetical protein V3V63_02740 [Candidatus Hydrothermarchaeaceae archaeon]